MDWDVFISYASEERQWVIENVFEPLSRCRTASGERPRIFFDIKGIDVSQNWQQALAEAIENSRNVVPVYSSLYFQKPMCQWELALFWTLDPNGDQGKIKPILMEPEAENAVPIQYSLINYMSILDPDWFERLCNNLQLSIDQEPTVLTFIDQPPAEIPANHTLPTLCVQMQAPSGQNSEEQIVIACREAQLQGSLSQLTENGMAYFEDLSLGTPAPEARLIATSKGCETAVSSSFTVLQPVAAPLQVPSLQEDEQTHSRAPLIYRHGSAVFFAGGTRLVIIGAGKAAVFDLEGDQIGPEHDVDPKLRLIQWANQLVAMIDWWGRILVLGHDGTIIDWEGPNKTEGLWIAGDVAINGDQLYVGFWTGDIYQIRLDSHDQPVWVLNNNNGIQRMAWADDSLLIVDMNGRVIQYRENVETELTHINGTIHLLKSYEGCVVGVGDEKLYYIQLTSERVFHQDLPFSGVESVLGQGEYPVVLGNSGVGVRFDSDLRYEVRFATGPGAVPVSADDSGTYCVLKNADGSLSLMVRDRIVLTHLGGTLAVAQDGKHFAIGDKDGIQIVGEDKVREWIEEKISGKRNH